MKKENYETPKVEIVTLDAENVMCASVSIDEDYSGGDVDYNPFGARSGGFNSESERSF